MLTKTIRTLLVSSIMALAVSSCTDEFFISGNGDVQSQNRTASSFDAVSTNGDFHVSIVQGSDYSIEVRAESNLLPYIETSVSNHTLQIQTTGVHSFRHHAPFEVFITQPTLSSLSLSGSGFIKTGSFVCENIDLSISGSGDIDALVNANHISSKILGSGNIYLSGMAKGSDFRISGSGKINSYDLVQDDCDTSISGSGHIYARVIKTLKVGISGSGSVYYKGNPFIQSSISGSGKIVPIN